MTHILKDLTHKKEGQPLKIEVRWILGKDIQKKSSQFHHH